MDTGPVYDNGQDAGFSLLEILVVISIMGFIAAMSAPRFGGVIRGALTMFTGTNMTRLVTFVSRDFQKDNRYPSGMINIVSVDGGAYRKPLVSDQDPDTDPEVLGFGMEARHRLFLHHLSAAEAQELRSLGVIHVFNLNSPDDRTVAAASPYMEKIEVAEGVGVLMTSGGDSDGNGVVESAEADLTEAGRGHPCEMFRMIFGLGPETSLIRDGLIANAATCPESGLAPINYTWKWYSLLLPRLAATEARLVHDDPLHTGGSVTAYAVTGSADAAKLSVSYRRTIDCYKEQNPAFFSVMDAEGATHPGVAIPGWGVDFSGDGVID